MKTNNFFILCHTFRVMSDELASAKSFFAVQYQESQNALEQLLDERHELRTNLVECNR